MPQSKPDASAQSGANRSPHLELGRRGEQLAAAFLEQQGYQIVVANFTVQVGRNLRGAIVNAEIDLVAYEETTLCFIEVKTRASDWFAPPQVNVDLRKRRQIARAARAYRRLLGLEASSYRYDVVNVVLPAEPAESLKIEVLRNYWTENTSRKVHQLQSRYYY